MILGNPGFRSYDYSMATAPKLGMTVQERDQVGFGTVETNGTTSIKRRNGDRLPYHIDKVFFEKFSPNTVFAQLVNDWKKDEVAGVIIRLSKSKSSEDAKGKQPMYRAVGWNQTVLLR